MLKIPDSEKYLAYEVGKFEYLESIPPWTLMGPLRLLEPHEYLYFYSYLADDDTPKPIKAAVGIMLRDDALRLYKDSYKFFRDQLVEEWADYYQSLSGQIKQMADSEIHHIKKFLYYTSSAPYQKYEVGSSLEVLQQNEAILNTQTEYMNQAVDEDAHRKRREFVEADLRAQDAKVKMNKKVKEISEDPELMKRREIWMSQHFTEYLAGYFVRHPISLMTDALKSELEYEVRTQVQSAHRQRLDPPSKLFGFYFSCLDLIYVSKSKSDFYKKMSEMKNPTLIHPIARIMKQRYTASSQNRGVASFSHPLSKQVVLETKKLDVGVLDNATFNDFIPVGADS